MTLEKYFNKTIKIVFADGDVIEGFVETYTPAYDNYPEEIEEIAINREGYSGLVVINADEFENEVESIEIIE